MSLQNTFCATIPKQHGAWVVLIACLALGMSAAGKFRFEVMLILLAVIAAFLGRNALSARLRPSSSEEQRQGLSVWAMLYFAVFLLAGAGLILGYKLWFLLPLGLAGFILTAVSLGLERIRKDMTAGGQIISILGIALAAPAMEYAAMGRYSSRTLAVWLICSLFFAGSIFHVRHMARKRPNSGKFFLERLKVDFPLALFNLGAFLTAVILTKFRIFPAYAPLAFIPGTLKALHLVGWTNNKPVSLKRVGYAELIHTLIFLVIAVFVFNQA